MPPYLSRAPHVPPLGLPSTSPWHRLSHVGGWALPCAAAAAAFAAAAERQGLVQLRPVCVCIVCVCVCVCVCDGACLLCVHTCMSVYVLYILVCVRVPHVCSLPCASQLCMRVGVFLMCVQFYVHCI